MDCATVDLHHASYASYNSPRSEEDYTYLQADLPMHETTLFPPRITTNHLWADMQAFAPPLQTTGFECGPPVHFHQLHHPYPAESTAYNPEAVSPFGHIHISQAACQWVVPSTTTSESTEDAGQWIPGLGISQGHNPYPSPVDFTGQWSSSGCGSSHVSALPEPTVPQDQISHCLPTGQTEFYQHSTPVCEDNFTHPETSFLTADIYPPTSPTVSTSNPDDEPWQSSSRNASPPAFATFDSRRRNVAVHPEQRQPKYTNRDGKCPHCDYVQNGRRAQDLRRHIKTHERPRNVPQYSCCGVPLSKASTYGMSNAVIREAAAIRIGEEIMVGGCGQSFSRRDALQRHLREKKGRCFGEALANWHPGNRNRGLIH